MYICFLFISYRQEPPARRPQVSAAGPRPLRKVLTLPAQQKILEYSATVFVYILKLLFCVCHRSPTALTAEFERGVKVREIYTHLHFLMSTFF